MLAPGEHEEADSPAPPEFGGDDGSQGDEPPAVAATSSTARAAAEEVDSPVVAATSSAAPATDEAGASGEARQRTSGEEAPSPASACAGQDDVSVEAEAAGVARQRTSSGEEATSPSSACARQEDEALEAGADDVARQRTSSNEDPPPPSSVRVGEADLVAQASAAGGFARQRTFSGGETSSPTSARAGAADLTVEAGAGGVARQSTSSDEEAPSPSAAQVGEADLAVEAGAGGETWQATSSRQEDQSPSSARSAEAGACGVTRQRRPSLEVAQSPSSARAGASAETAQALAPANAVGEGETSADETVSNSAQHLEEEEEVSGDEELEAPAPASAVGDKNLSADETVSNSARHFEEEEAESDDEDPEAAAEDLLMESSEEDAGVVGACEPAVHSGGGSALPSVAAGNLDLMSATSDGEAAIDVGTFVQPFCASGAPSPSGRAEERREDSSPVLDRGCETPSAACSPFGGAQAAGESPFEDKEAAEIDERLVESTPPPFTRNTSIKSTEAVAALDGVALAQQSIHALSWSDGPLGEDTWRAASTWTLKRVCPGATGPLLEGLGLSMLDEASWQASPRESGIALEVKLEGHTKHAEHTWYQLECALHRKEEEDRFDPAKAAGWSSTTQWVAPRRLTQLRDDLHAPVKEALGAAYAPIFGATPFAKKGGPPGTTARLRAWFVALAAAFNAGRLPPRLAALVLLFVQAPTSLGVTSSSALDLGDASGRGGSYYGEAGVRRDDDSMRQDTDASPSWV